MQGRSKVQHLMPLMREFGGLERKRLGDGVTPLEFQRWLDLKGQIGRAFARSRQAGLSAIGGEEPGTRETRLLVTYRSRDALLDAVVDQIQPVGLFVPTPFAAEIGTKFLVRVSLEAEAEAESADLPSLVVTSVAQGAQTLSTMSMGMGLKLRPPPRALAAGISKLFAGALDARLKLPG